MFNEDSGGSASIPQELNCPLPRPVRLTGLGVTSCIVALICVVFGLGLAFKSVNSELRREAGDKILTQCLVSEGSETNATITGLRSQLGYVVDYQFAVDGQNFTKSVFVSEARWQSEAVGGSIAIRYLPTDPAKSYPVGEPPNAQNHWAMVLPMAAIAILFMGIFATTQLVTVFPRRRLLALGCPERGVVASCRQSQGRRGGYIVSYTFTSSDGKVHGGRTRYETDLSENSAVTVLYDPDHPTRSTLYPVDTVRLSTAS